MKLNIIKDDEGNLCLEFTDEQLEELGLKVGDEIIWEKLDDGNWSFHKKEESDGEL